MDNSDKLYARIAELEGWLAKHEEVLTATEAKHDAERADHDKTCQRIAELEAQVATLRAAAKEVRVHLSQYAISTAADRDGLLGDAYAAADNALAATMGEPATEASRG